MTGRARKMTLPVLLWNNGEGLPRRFSPRNDVKDNSNNNEKNNLRNDVKNNPCNGKKKTLVRILERKIKNGKR